jgi:uncharacterized protein (DUF433 family)
MNLPLQPEPVPLWADERGDIRVGKTRILFDVLVDLHRQGTSPKDIVAGYPDLDLAEVYGALAYYYRHQEAADEYLRQREEEARQMRRQIEDAQRDLPEGLKARREAFQAQKELAGA